MINLKELGNRIKQRRTALHLTQEELAKRSGYTSRSSINKIELGMVDLPQSKIKAIADALDTTPAFFMGWDEQSKQNDEIVDEVTKMYNDPTYLKRKKGIKIPVYGNVAAGVPILAVENFDSNDPDDWEEITEEMASTGEYFALRIHGDSMVPRMQERDGVIVRLQQSIETGDIAIVRVNGDEATCKKIKKTPEGLILISINPSYEPMFYSPKDVETLPVEIIGKVVELRAKF